MWGWRVNEHGNWEWVYLGSWPYGWSPTPALSDSDVDRIANRIIQMLAERLQNKGII